jgi:mannose/fructose/N-acetylgalactosamine-specific phosphotransferase system component IIC
VYLTEDQMTYFFAGFAVACGLSTLAALFAPRVCGGKDSWLGDILKSDGPFAWGLLLLQLAVALSLVGCVIAAPITYYNVVKLEQEAEAMRQGYEQVYIPGSKDVTVWRKSAPPSPAPVP